MRKSQRPNRHLARCSRTGKRRFRDHAEAVVALQRAHNARLAYVEMGIEGPRRETRCYACLSCKGWHLTSRAAVTPNTATF